MTEFLVEFLSQLGIPTRVFLLSLLPVTELRASLPLAVFWGLPPGQAYFVAVLGNLLPVPFLLWLLPWLVCLLGRIPVLNRWLERLLRRTRGRQGLVKNWGTLGLLLFVAIPAPGTGAWTGSLLAYLLGIPWPLALLAIALGVAVAGFVVLAASLGLVQVVMRGGTLGLAVVALGVLILYWWRKRNNN